MLSRSKRPLRAARSSASARGAARAVASAALLSTLFAVPSALASAPPAALLAAPDADPRVITVKFKDDTDVASDARRLEFASASTEERIARILGTAGVADTAPVFDIATSRLDADRDRLQAKGKRVPDLTTFVRVRLQNGADRDVVLAKLNADPQVETAYPAPARAKVASTPDLAFHNTSVWEATTTVNPTHWGITAAGSVPGALGQHVTVAQLEYAIDIDHEDLVRTPRTVTRVDPDDTSSGAVDPSDRTHGTQTAGVIAAKRDGIGIDGIAPNVKLEFYNAVNGGVYRNEAPTLYRAAAALQPGDVIQMALQSAGVPVEFTPETYAAVVHAVERGIIVVEAAGNSNKDLDSPAYAGSFAQGLPESGAIIVGAGTCSAPTRQSNSTYGARVNVQGPGDCYWSTGGNATSSPSGAVYAGDPTTINDNYSPYADTSLASSVIAGLTASLSSAYEQATGAPIRPRDARAALIATGQAQDTSSIQGHVGPVPNLAAAIAHATAAPDTQITSGPTGAVDRPTFAFASTATTTVTGYECRIVPVGGTAPAFTPCSGTSSHQPAANLADGEYRFEVRARKGPAAGGADPTPATKSFWVVTDAGDAEVDATNQVAFTARAGHANRVSVRQSGTTYTIWDDAQRVRAGSGCTQLDLNAVQCAHPSVSSVVVDGGDGNDRLDVSTAKASAVDGGTGTDTVLGGIGYAWLMGGAGDDTITAGTGGSALDGGAGADTLTGGAGNDTLDYQERTDALVVNLSAGVVESGDTSLGNDDVDGSIEVVIGGLASDAFLDAPGNQRFFGLDGDDEFWLTSSGDDLAFGGEGADSFTDGAGNDRYYGEAGTDDVRLFSTGDSDQFQGGADTDAVSYSTVGAGVTVSNDGVKNDGVQSVTSQLDNIGTDVENVWGGDGNDTLVASATSGMLHGQGGDDTFVSAAGPGGGLYGGAGTDKVDYSGRAVNVSLQPLTDGTILARFGGTGLSVLSQIDHVIGTEQADVLVAGTGGAGDRPLRIEGRGGNDTLTGGAAADVLIGGAGVDRLDGAAGDDRLELKDGVTPEQFWCRSGNDTAMHDAADAPQDIAACETRTT